MRLAGWKRWLPGLSVTSPRTRGKTRRPSQRLCLEALEDRTLPATITWTSPVSGNFTDGSNWSGGVAPGSGDVAVINTAAAATITISTAVQVQSISTAATDTILITGNPFTGGNLTVAGGTAVLTGPLTMTGGQLTVGANPGGSGNLTANGPTSITDANLTAFAGTLSLPQMTSYSNGHGNIFLAFQAMAGSRLNLPALTTLGTATLSIVATTGGEVDVPALSSINATSQNPLDVAIESDGTLNNIPSKIDLSGLTHFTGDRASFSSFTVTHGATILAPNLPGFTGVSVVLDGTGTVATSQWTFLVNGALTEQDLGVFSPNNLTNVDGSQLLAQSGASLTLPNLTSYADTNLNSFVTFEATGSKNNTNSKLNLPALKTLGALALRIWAFQGGEVDVPMITAIASTSQTVQNVDVEAANPGSKIDLSGLTSFTGATVLSSGFSVTTQATVLAGNLTQFDGVAVSLDGTGTVATGQWTRLTNGFLTENGGVFSSANLTNVDGSQLLAEAAGTLTLSNLSSYADANINSFLTFEATGAGSKLSLPKLATLGQVALRIWAFKGGEVDLPALTTIASTSQASKTVDVEAADAGSKIDLSALTNFAAATALSSGFSVITQATVLDGSLTTLDKVAVTLDGTGTVATNQWTSLTNGSLTITGGTYTFPGLTLTGSNVSVQNSASLTLGGGTGNGSFSVSSGATLDFEGAYALAAASSVAGAGTVILGAGAHTIAGSYSITGATQLTGGTATFSGAAATGTTTLAGASTLGIAVGGTSPGSFGQLNATGSVNLNSAHLQVTHTTATPGGSTFTILTTTTGVSGAFNGLAEGAVVTAPDGVQFTVSYLANGGKNVTLTELTPPVSTVASLSPASGPVGTIVIIQGTRLFGATAVKFGNVSASFTVNSDTQIRAIVPSGAGNAAVAVTTSLGTATSAGNFTATAFKTASATGAAGQFPSGLAAGDFNGDSALDAVTANYGPTGGNSVTVLFGTGAGSFGSTPTTIALGAGTAPFGVTTGKFVDGSNNLSIVTGNFTGQSVTVLLGNGNGTFKPALTLPAKDAANGLHKIVSVAVGDLNGDGHQDIVAGSGDGTYTVFLGNGNGTFNPLPSRSALTPIFGIAIANVDTGSGPKPSLIAAAFAAWKVAVLPGNGDGTFAGPIFSSTGAGTSAQTNEFLATGDFNHDGKVDVATSNKDTNNLSVLLGNGNGTFGPATLIAAGTIPMTVSVADINKDGNLDVAVANLGSNSASVFLGNGDGTFGAVQTVASGLSPLAMAVGDFNPTEGMLDLVFANFVGSQHDTVTLAKNNTAAPPIISSVAPGSGAVNAQVVLFGANFFLVNSVAFNGTPTTNFHVDSSTQITVFVPTGASSGVIGVAAGGGIGVSALPFTVT